MSVDAIVATRGQAPLSRRMAAEFVGTALLLAGIVGSGIMARRLTSDPGLQLLQNAWATAAVLSTLILALGPLSGAHFNPVVSVADAFFGGLDRRETIGYVLAQIAGGACGAILANLMFGLDAVTWSTTDRGGAPLWLAEVVATAGLLLVIFAIVRSNRGWMAAWGVGGYIAGAFYFTSSTSFANPAVTLARTLTDTFTGIRPGSAPGFVVAEIVGMVVAIALVSYLFPGFDDSGRNVIVPHEAA